MEILAQDFTPLFTREKASKQHTSIQDEIAKLLSLLNTHRMITDGGAQLYKDKQAYEKIYLKETLGYDLVDNHDVAQFLAVTISNLAEAAFSDRKSVLDVAHYLNEFDPDNEESIKQLEKIWLEKQELIEELIYLYSEYLYKVYLDNPYRADLIGLKKS